jgi:hypothetical protein
MKSKPVPVILGEAKNLNRFFGRLAKGGLPQNDIY